MSKPQTIRVRIAVAVGEKGSWAAAGNAHLRDVEAMSVAMRRHPGEALIAARYWVTADLPLPQVGEVQGRVEEAKP